MKNLGKVFEENFKKSVPSHIFYYRFRDSGGNWNRTEKSRFTISNIADNLIFYNDKLFLNELKSHKGKSIPLEKIIGNKTKIKQINDLFNASFHKNIYCNIIVFFSDVERCFSLDIKDLKDYIDSETAKSIPIAYFEKYGKEIKVSKLRTNYRFDIESWLNNV